MNQRIARVFPRQTKASPVDDLAFFGPPGLFPPEVDAVHVSVAFSWDLRRAEELARDWAPVAPVTIGGPATGQRGEEFTPGMYLREGYTITSRGCPNKCWFCQVWRREGPTVEWPVKDGWNVLDDNLLACGDDHIAEVFAMLKRQPFPAEFTGGLEAARLEPWHVDELAVLKPRQLFLAYDEDADLEPLLCAADMLRDAGLIRPGGRQVRCYVLMGYPKDTQEAANERCQRVLDLGIMPMGMLWKDEKERTGRGWKALQREWANAFILGSKMGAAAA
jgi:hypothetical protein